ncbi:MAG: hypothetical protein GXN94_05330, partial [Aquificae bacterium]|nr:hypothetical protein [Aquificota bacterium]
MGNNCKTVQKVRGLPYGEGIQAGIRSKVNQEGITIAGGRPAGGRNTERKATFRFGGGSGAEEGRQSRNKGEKTKNTKNRQEEGKRGGYSLKIGGFLIPLLIILFSFFPLNSQAETENSQIQAGNLSEEVQKVYRLRKIEIKGLKYVKPELIYPLITIGKGAIVTRDNIVNILRDLYKLGYFREIETYTRYTENGVDLIFVFEELPVVQKIEFEGNEEISDEDLMQVLGIQTQERTESGGAIPFSTLGPELAEKMASIRRGLGRVFSIDEINRMVKAIKEKYEKEGFYNVKVSYYFKGNTLVFKIDEGQRAYVKKIIIIGNRQIDEDEIKDVMETKERAVWKLRFHPRLKKEVLYEDIERIRELYINKGFFEVQVSKPKIELKNGEEYYITIEIKEGPRYRLSGLE